MELLNLNAISKSFPVTDKSQSNLLNVWRILRNKEESGTVRVLEDITFSVKKGESLAVIGKNGAGKSTLLKILSGVIQATSGTLKVNGTIGALLELGSGFDPEYTGIENLKLATSLAGMGKSESHEKIKKMVAFADIGEHINQPVKTYSSGMIVRLGFAAMTEIRPDLLITDEILAVGDENFQLKCLAWIKDYLAQGGTLLLVSHNMYHVQSICQKALWIEDGVVKSYGNAHDVAHEYQADIHDKLQYDELIQVNPHSFHIQSVEFDNPDMNYETDGDINITVKLYSPDHRVPGLSMGIVNGNELPVYGTFSDICDGLDKSVTDNEVMYHIKIPKVQLLPGYYRFKFHTMTPDHLQMIDTIEKEVTIQGHTKELGVTRLKTEWS